MIFSQNNEQSIILNYFSDFQDRTFVDIGSNDGKTLSNTHALALAGWSGVCIEPDPKPFEKLETLYSDNPKIQCFNVAIGDKSGTLPFYSSDSHLSGNDSGLLSTLDKNEIPRWKGTQKFEQIEVDVLTWKDFLSLPDLFEKFDFISVDAEGMDLIILRQMNLKELGCEMLCIEWNGNVKVRKEVDAICRSFGLRFEHQNFENLIYVL
jgi:FkbM family methyltransferase